MQIFLIVAEESSASLHEGHRDLSTCKYRMLGLFGISTFNDYVKMTELTTEDALLDDIIMQGHFQYWELEH